MRKARGTMLAMKAPEAVIPIDCEVSAWRSNTEECKAQCTSLLQGDRVVKYSLTRDVVTAGNEYGVSCDTFTLEKKEVCPSSACPRDCVMSDWSPWSECSAECGVGVRHRIRYVVHEVRFFFIVSFGVSDHLVDGKMGRGVKIHRRCRGLVVWSSSWGGPMER